MKRKKIVFLSGALILIGIVIGYGYIFQMGFLPFSYWEVKGLEAKCRDGDANACGCLAMYYFNEEDKYLYWLQKSSDLGDAHSQYFLSKKLSNSSNVQDIRKSLKLLEQSASNGFWASQSELAQAYLEGTKLPQDHNKALMWFSKSAQQGHLRAMLQVAKIRMQASGDEQNLIEAYVWATLALKRSAPQSVLYDNSKMQKIAVEAAINRVGLEYSSIIQRAMALSADRDRQVPLLQETESQYGCKYSN